MKTKIDKPKFVIVEITDRCNFKCKHCFANKSDSELDLASWKKIFENINKEKIKYVTISGGEPLLYKDLFFLLKDVRSNDAILTLDTNGSLINESNVKFIERYFSKVRITHFGINKSWHANTQSDEIYEYKFYQALRILCDSKSEVHVKIPLFNNNVNNLFKILDDLKRFDIDKIILVPINYFGKDTKIKNFVTSSEAKKLIKEYGDKTRNIKVSRWPKFRQFLIRSNGDVVLSPPIGKEEMLLGNAMDMSISELWDKVPDEYKHVNED